MKLDSCGIPEEQFIEIFQKKAQFLGRLLIVFHPGARQIMEEKIAWEMFQECIYATETEAREISDPNGKNDPFNLTFVSREEMMKEIKAINDFVSREEMMKEIKAINDKVDTLIKLIT